MKRLFLSLFLISLIGNLFAEISVKTFRKLENDLDARVGETVIKDFNGEPSAIIKVVTTQTGFTFDCGQIGIVKTINKPGEIWVYIPNGAKRITIAHEKLGVLRDWFFTFPIEKATVYEMVLITGKVTTIIEEEQIQTEWVVITTEPSGADVYIDDKSTGLQTPYSKQLPLGTHTYSLNLDMYHTDAGKFELKPDAGKLKLNSPLIPNFGELKLSSTPERGATITLDGISLSQTTPCTIDKIKSGTHTITVNKLMFHEITQIVEIIDGKTTTLDIDLKPAFGSITVSSTPESGAAIILDDVSTSKVSPCTLDKVKSGVHIVTLRREWYAPIKKQITINDGEKAVLEVPMNPLFGDVKITTTPESYIFIDNEKVATGTYSARMNEGIYTFEARKAKYTSDIQKIQIATGESKTISLAPRPQLGILQIESTPIDATISVDGVNKGTTPATLRNLLVGNYQISLALPNYATVNKTITIIEGQTTKVNETLANGRLVTINSTPNGANLFVDGNSVGTPPFSGNLTFGNHTLGIEKEEKKADKIVNISQTGGETSFSLDFVPTTITDIDGNVYHTVTIGTQTWMVENLKTTHYRNGNPIPNITEKATWSALTTGACCDSDNKAANGIKYGHLYNWFAVSDNRNIAPQGWHVATDAEWTILESYVSANLGKSGSVGKALAANTNWESCTKNGQIGNNLLTNNSSGFSALPGGYRNYDDGSFNNVGYGGYWWSSTEDNTDYAWGRGMNYCSSYVGRGRNIKQNGFSVRCVRDY